jgi:hypothetical protein
MVGEAAFVVVVFVVVVVVVVVVENQLLECRGFYFSASVICTRPCG